MKHLRFALFVLVLWAITAIFFGPWFLPALVLGMILASLICAQMMPKGW
jgi:hypothetical protein